MAKEMELSFRHVRIGFLQCYIPNLVLTRACVGVPKCMNAPRDMNCAECSFEGVKLILHERKLVLLVKSNRHRLSFCAGVCTTLYSCTSGVSVVRVK